MCLQCKVSQTSVLLLQALTWCNLVQSLLTLCRPAAGICLLKGDQCHRCNHTWYARSMHGVQCSHSKKMPSCGLRQLYTVIQAVHESGVLQGQGRNHPGQQPKLQQQPHHVIKASQGPVQVCSSLKDGI